MKNSLVKRLLAGCLAVTLLFGDTAGVLAALRHILQGDFARCFAFSLPAADMLQLARLMERFLLAQQQRRYNTLDFYHTLRPELV